MAASLKAQEIRPMPADSAYGVVHISVCNLREEGKFTSGMSTQALLGMPVKVLQYNGWYEIQTPDDYTGWVHRMVITPMSKERYDEWNRAEKIVVTSHYGFAYEKPDESSQPVSDVVAGNAQAGSSAAASGTKNNDYYEEWLAQQGIDPSKTQITEVDNPETILGGGNLDLSVSVIMAITGEGLADLTAQMADTIKIDTSSISPSMNIAYNTGVSNKSKVILQNVSKVADKAITIGTGVYSVYMDSTKYNDLSLIGAVTLDVGSLYLINSTDKIVVDKFGTSKPMIYGIKTMSGTVAYLVDENVLTPIKKNWDDFVQGRNE
nr:SH3 domain-containing protein [uncultured Phascolarctobacterium sp.]